ncbi:hypothetical protein C0Q70_13187 [Pomacea canaliculata]|uniref:Uncharacterized protein n=1 Tax=Pomacea canaliculata TaxID=400727 RepID=A0A2T7NWI7_POMCA|nr:hypothetical protein C0Q70_13187 [Pomacea canaliculata]
MLTPVLSELESSHLSPQQPHLHDNDESRPDGGSVNHHFRDLPPSYLSVVTDPRYIRENGDSVQQPPSYDDVVAVMRQTKAPSDRPVTSTSLGNTFLTPPGCCCVILCV